MKVIIALLAAVALAIPRHHSSHSDCSGSYSCDTCHEHHHHHHEHPHHHHDHHHHDDECITIDSSSTSSDVVLVDQTKPVVVAPVNNAVAPKEVKPANDAVVVVVPNTNPVYTVDPAQQAPYKNGLTIDMFTTCSGNKVFIAKRNNGIYTESYNIAAAGQTKPKIYM